MIDKRVIFTNHAKDRALERCHLTEEKARKVLSVSREIEIPPGRWSYKFQKYGRDVGNTHLFYDPLSHVSFTILNKNGRTNKCFLVITVVKRKYKKVDFISDSYSLKLPLDN